VRFYTAWRVKDMEWYLSGHNVDVERH